MIKMMMMKMMKTTKRARTKTVRTAAGREKKRGSGRSHPIIRRVHQSPVLEKKLFKVRQIIMHLLLPLYNPVIA